jgi:hypothetical protein
VVGHNQIVAGMLPSNERLKTGQNTDFPQAAPPSRQEKSHRPSPACVPEMDGAIQTTLNNIPQ